MTIMGNEWKTGDCQKKVSTNSKLSWTFMNRKEGDILDDRERNRGSILLLMSMGFFYVVVLNHCTIIVT
jgi:hypothetical protein